MKRIVTYFFTMLIVIISLAGCTRVNEDDANSLNIVTSFYPMYIATSNIIDGAANVTLKSLASPDVGCLHDYQLTVNDMITLEKADVFVINGGGMESFWDKAISNYPELKIINAFIDGDEHESGDEDATEKLEHDEEHTHNHDHDNDVNAHIWVSISLYIEQIEKICEQLKSINPENAEI